MKEPSRRKYEYSLNALFTFMEGQGTPLELRYLHPSQVERRMAGYRDRAVAQWVRHFGPLSAAVPHDEELKHVRDRALLGLLGCRRRARWKSRAPMSPTCRRMATAGRSLVHGKYHDRLVFLRPDVAEAVEAYLTARGSIQPDELGEALIVADGNFVRGHRLSRPGQG